MDVLPLCLCVYLVCAWSLQRPEEPIGSPQTGVTDNLWAIVWVLEAEPRYSARDTELLTDEPSAQLLIVCFGGRVSCSPGCP